MKKIMFIIAFVTVLSPFVLSDSMTALSINQGYSSNLFNDSFALADAYTIVSSDLLLYPTDMMELNIYGDYTLYSETSGLSNFLAGASFTFIPTDETMKSQLYFNSTVSLVRYGTEFNLYNNAVISGSGSWNYQLSQKLFSKIGGGVSSKKYTNTSSVTDKMYYVYGGFNSTLFGRNSINIETAYYKKQFITDDSFNSDNTYVDLTVRYSRPLGSTMGLNVSYLKRYLETDNDAYLPGFTIDYLSPWSSLWGGEEISFSLKKILPNQFIVVLGAVYSEKSYIDQLESDLGVEPVYSIFSRNDTAKIFSFRLEKKYYTGKSLIVPRFSISYIDNSSSIDLYNYEKVSFNGSLSLNF